MVCGFWRLVWLEGTEQGLGHIRQHRSPRSHSFSGSCGTTGNFRQLAQRAEAPDNPAERYSPVGKFASGLLEKHRSIIMDGLRKFVAVDNRKAVTVGDLHRETVPESGKTKVNRVLGSGHPGRRG